MSSSIKGRRVKIPEFEIVSNPTIKISDIKRRAFGIIDRAVPWYEELEQILEEELDDERRTSKKT